MKMQLNQFLNKAIGEMTAAVTAMTKHAEMSQIANKPIHSIAAWLDITV